MDIKLLRKISSHRTYKAGIWTHDLMLMRRSYVHELQRHSYYNVKSSLARFEIKIVSSPLKNYLAYNNDSVVNS
jgi:hypothetical protein